jgi:hypothetical protein
MDYNEVHLAYCHILAITGQVGLHPVDPGTTIFSGSSSTLVVITQRRFCLAFKIGAHSHSHWRRVSINSVGLGSEC